MPAFRLVFLIAAVVGLLAAVAISSSPERNRRSTTGDRTTTALPAPRYPPRQTVEAKLPRTDPIRAHVGDLIVLRFTRERADIVELDVFGVREGFAGGVPTVLRFIAARPGTFSLHLRQADKPLVKLIITPRRPLGENDAATPAATATKQ